MEIFDADEDREHPSFCAHVEIIDELYGKFVCPNCHGDGRLNCATDNGQEKCNSCKGSGFLLVGL